MNCSSSISQANDVLNQLSSRTTDYIDREESLDWTNNNPRKVFFYNRKLTATTAEATLLTTTFLKHANDK